jgi:hypothetical protein
MLQPDRKVSGLLSLVGTLAVVFACVAQGLPRNVLTNDGPQHSFAGEARVVANPLYDSISPPTSNGAVQTYEWVRRATHSTQVAQSAPVVLAIALWASGFAALALRLDRRRWPTVLFAGAGGIQFATAVGLVPFQLACGLALWALVIGVDIRTAWRAAALACLLCGTAWLHIFVVPLAAAGLVGLALGSAKPARAMALAAFSCIPAVAYAVLTALSFSSGRTPSAARDVDVDVVDGVAALGRDFLFGPPWRAAVVLGLSAVALVLIVRVPTPSRRLGIVGMLVLAAAVIAPADLASWQIFRPRLLPLGFAFLWAAAPIEVLGRRSRWALAALGLAASISSGVWWHLRMETLDEKFSPAVAALAQAPQQHATWTPLVLVADGPMEPSRIAPWLHLGQLAALHIGGAPAYSHDSSPLVHHILRRGSDAALYSPTFPGRWPEAWNEADPARRARVITALSTWTAPFGQVVAYGRRDDIDAIVAGGVVVDDVKDVAFDRVVVAGHFVGCDIDVDVEGGDGAIVELGFVPGESAVDVDVVDSGDARRFIGGPCGRVWVRSTPACREALGGRVVVDVAFDGLPTRVVCTLADD